MSMIEYPPGEALTCQQLRELDVLAIEHVGIPGIVLMENAARAAAEHIYGWLVHPQQQRVVLLCGRGNNGGDGFVIARHVHNAGVPVQVVLAAPAEKIEGDALVNLKILERMAFALTPAYAAEGLAGVPAMLAGATMIVDALLGTGSSGAPRGATAELIQMANAAAARRVAIDIPSGLDADSGVVHEPCLRADATITMVAPKPGFAAAAAQAVLGRVIVVDIGVPRTLIPGRPENSGRG